MEIRVRKAADDDYAGMCELFDELDALHRDNLPQIFQKPGGAARDKDYYLGLISDEGIGLFVASTGEQLVGFVHAILRDTLANPVLIPSRYVVVDAVVVRLGWQNRGIGSLLMEKAQEWALAKGATSIELNVYEFNESAIAFYEKLGYRTLSRKMRKELKVGKTAG